MDVPPHEAEDKTSVTVLVTGANRYDKRLQDCINKTLTMA